MTLGELRAEFLARGFDYLDPSGTTRQDRYLNQAYLVDVAEPWPWPDLETTTTGTAPLTIADLKDVIHVIDTTSDNQLSVADSRDLADLDTDYATTTGTPQFWYVTDEGAITTYPLNSGSTFSVLYLKVPTVLSTANDEPVLPSRVHPLIVDYAVVQALIDRDNFEAAEKLKGWADARLKNLAESVLWKSSDPARITIAAGALDW